MPFNFVDCVFSKASDLDVKDFVLLIDARIEWMNLNGINQWNNTDYKQRYPTAYFKHEADLGLLYVLKSGNLKILAGAVLLDEDPRWSQNNPHKASLYVHNFAASLDIKGAGKEFLQRIENMALQKGKECVRLDVIIGNDKLNAWYEKMGYQLVGTTIDGVYHGNLREKSLKLKAD